MTRPAAILAAMLVMGGCGSESAKWDDCHREYDKPIIITQVGQWGRGWECRECQYLTRYKQEVCPKCGADGCFNPCVVRIKETTASISHHWVEGKHHGKKGYWCYQRMACDSIYDGDTTSITLEKKPNAVKCEAKP